jgi:hypothetical protein
MPLRAAIEDAFVIERSGWAVERVERVTAALQSSRPSGSRMETLVVWMEDYTAFTAPGDAIYLSRRLLEVLPSDAAVAFVIAHERAHHALGHVPNFDLSLGASSVRLGLTILGRWVHSTRHERDADLFAIEQCVAAGYDAAESIEALECLEKIALDYGHVDAVVNHAEARARAPQPPTPPRTDRGGQTPRGRDGPWPLPRERAAGAPPHAAAPGRYRCGQRGERAGAPAGAQEGSLIDDAGMPYREPSPRGCYPFTGAAAGRS